MVAAVAPAPAAQLSTDARGAIPHDVQQFVVIDYQAMQNSTAAMNLRNRVMPPELKQFDEALSHSRLWNDKPRLWMSWPLRSSGRRRAATRCRPWESPRASSTRRRFWPTSEAQKVKATLVRTNSLYPMAKTGIVLCFVDPSTMIFGSKDAVIKALDARDGMAASLLTNSPLMSAMQSVDSSPLWSILDDKGTQTLMKQLLGEAGSLTDYDTVKKRLVASWYAMDFQHGVRFDLTIETGDSFAAATISSLLSAAVMVRKMSATDTEKTALNETSIDSSSGKLDRPFCGLGHGVQRAVAVAAVPDHGALKDSRWLLAASPPC